MARRLVVEPLRNDGRVSSGYMNNHLEVLDSSGGFEVIVALVVPRTKSCQPDYLQRRSSTGGFAYGIPRNSATLGVEELTSPRIVRPLSRVTRGAAGDEALR